MGLVSCSSEGGLSGERGASYLWCLRHDAARSGRNPRRCGRGQVQAAAPGSASAVLLHER